MIARMLLLPLFVTALIAFLGCTPAADPPPNDPPPPEDVPPINVPPEDLKALVDGNNQFAIDLYKKLAETEKGNIVFSPYSISSALAMTYAGARGQTAEEMAKVLGITKLGDKVHPAHAYLARRLTSANGKDKNPEFHVANSLWGQQGMSFRLEFLNLTKRHYGGGFRELDFSGDTEGSRKTINGWVGEQTRDKIPELIKKDILKSNAALVLTNAICFKSDWASRFEPNATKDGPFFRTPSDSVIVPLMTQEATFRYAEVGDAQMLELPYAGGDFSMVLVLPKRAEDMGQVQAALAGKSLQVWLSKAVERTVKVTLPKFRLRMPVDLIPPLKQLGMRNAFDGAADFSGITGSRSLLIDAVVHEAFIDVDEKGTEASGATAVILTRRGVTPFDFRVDRQFLYLIVDRTTGSIAFLGRFVG